MAIITHPLKFDCPSVALMNHNKQGLD